MLRSLASRRVILGAVSVAVTSLPDSPHEKLSIYPAPVQEVVLQETPSELERQIRTGRRAVTGVYVDAHARLQGLVSQWIGVEHAVERRVKSIIPKDEPLTPGLLYVGVATLTGSIVARNRSFVTRLVIPPTLFLLSLNHFLPKTSHNLADYFGSLEETYVPGFAEKHETAKQHTAMTWQRLKAATASGRETIGTGVKNVVGKMQDATGLKLREALGWEQEAQRLIEEKAKEAVGVVEQKSDEVRAVVDKKVEEIKRLV